LTTLHYCGIVRQFRFDTQTARVVMLPYLKLSHVTAYVQTDLPSWDRLWPRARTVCFKSNMVLCVIFFIVVLTWGISKTIRDTKKFKLGQRCAI